MALTTQDKQDLLNALKADSLSMDELPSVSTLDGILSLPAVKDGDLVSAPLSLLSTPATTAAARAETAASAASSAATAAKEATTAASSAAENATTAATVAKETAQQAAERAVKEASEASAAANEAASKANEAATEAEGYATDMALARGGASARFDGMVEGVDIQQATTEAPEGVYYDSVRKQFCAKAGGVYYRDWVKDGDKRHEALFMDTDTHTVLRDKAYICSPSVYVWDDGEGNLVEISGAGKGSLTSVTLNGQRFEADEEGNVTLTVAETEVDDSLQTDSTNPVQNRVVAARLAEVEAHTLGSVEVVPDGDDNYLYAYDLKGKAIASTKLPAGGGGGGSQTSRILVTAAVSAALVKEGGTSTLTWTYDHVNAEGEPDGVKATVTVSVRQGTATLLTEERRNVARGSYTLALDSCLLSAGQVDVYVRAECTTDSGEQQTKQAYASVTVASLALTSDYDVSQGASRGGYTDADTVSIPFALTGSGTRTVSMYLDGTDEPVTKTVTKSGTTRDSFTLPASALAPGRHTVQLVAEREGLSSDVVWIDLLKAGPAAAPWVGLMFSAPGARVVTGSMPLTPTLSVRQFERLTLQYAAYDPAATPATVTDSRTQDGKTEEGAYSVGRTRQTYTVRFTSRGAASVTLACAGASAAFAVDVLPSSLDIAEATLGQTLRLTASGRSNREADPAVWTSGSAATEFEGVDWSTSGWDGTALRLRDGARATVGYMPFATDVKQTGCTVEVEIMVRSVTDRTAALVSCMQGGKGITVTAESAALYSGSTVDREDEENTDPDTGRPIVTKVPVGVESKYNEGTRLRMAFVVRTQQDGGVMELYMNGDRCAAMCYQTDDNFRQDSPAGVTLDSAGAELRVYSLRAYTRALEDDEIVDNYIIGQDDPDTMAALYEQNAVTAEETGGIDLDRILARGRAAIFIVRSDDSGDGLDDVNACKNKKQNFHVDEMTIHTPWGDTYRATDIMMRIQGTSSTKYPVKNYRFYWAKTAREGATPKLYKNGEPVAKNKLPLFEGDTHPCKVSCAKADFSDSSMKTNTGMACLFNDVLRTLAPVPPQQDDPTVRTAIYGYPCDIFAATQADEAHPKFYGQYQMNNDKSDWYEVTGMTDPDSHIALEFLDNGKRLCNFQTDEDIDTQLTAEFDTSFEFNYPKDTFWQGADTEAGEADASEYQRTAVKTMLQWVGACVPAGADLTCTDLSTWKSEKFTTEVSAHFSLTNLLHWYLLTEYFAMVDQRAKNTIWRTWDGQHWYVTYYDGDTMLGKRNDSLLAYLYNVARTSWDAEKKKWVFEGHDSWLWCLLLANCQTELRTAAEDLRRQLTNAKVTDALDTIERNWSLREYNRSGYMKYIRPETEGVRVSENGTTTDGNRFYYMYALSGTRSMQLSHFITRRFALLDARLGVSNYRADSAGFYLARETSDPADTITITAADEYYFAYGLSGKDYMEGETGRLLRGETGTLSVSGKRALNDPMLLFGASRILRLDMTGAASHLLNGLELGSCTALTTLDLSVPEGGAASKTTWWLVTDGCTQLADINLNGQTGARSNRQDSTTLDFSGQTLLRRLDARGTRVRSVAIAAGAPVTELRLPATLTTLRLDHLARLTPEGLTVESLDSVTTLVIDSCPQLSWQDILDRCTALAHLRITGIDTEGDGALLDRLSTVGGVSDEGAYTDTCALTGTYRLTRYVDEETYAAYTAHFPELTVVQPEYSMIEYDLTVEDEANISNPDNATGYRYGNEYTPSGHIAAILARRHRCLAKLTRKPTTRTLEMAGQTLTANNTDGEMTYCLLSDSDSNRYADGTAAALDGTEGDYMMYEPFFWSKGVNDYLGGRNYSCYSSRDRDHKPSAPEADILTLDGIKAQTGRFLAGQKVVAGGTNITGALKTDSNYSVCIVSVAGRRRVRFPSVLGTGQAGAAFVTAAGQVVQDITVSTLGARFENGMYLIADIPATAALLYFTIHNKAEFDKVVITDSTRIEDMEPDWVANDAHLLSVAHAAVIGSRLCSVGTATKAADGISWIDFHTYARQRGMQMADCLMHFRLANLAYARYGHRDIRTLCGLGRNTNDRTQGSSASHGMTDTIGYARAHALDADVTGTPFADGSYEYAWYADTDTFGAVHCTRVDNISCLGYENLWGNKSEFMTGAELLRGDDNGKWRIHRPDGGVFKVQGVTFANFWTGAVAHGLHMFLVPVGPSSASSSTGYVSLYQYYSADNRLLFRGGYNLGQGLAYAYALIGPDAAGSTYWTTRLAFRGTLVQATVPAVFKALTALL